MYHYPVDVDQDWVPPSLSTIKPHVINTSDIALHIMHQNVRLSFTWSKSEQNESCVKKAKQKPSRFQDRVYLYGLCFNTAGNGLCAMAAEI